MGKIGRTFLILFLIATVTSCEKDEGGASAIQNASFTIPDYSDAVDLGLSVRWAPFNIGASDTYEYGNYYAWGETDFKKSYTEKTYSQPQTDDYNGIAAGSYDVAGVQWGKGWRLPTKREIEELEKLCKRSEYDVYGSRVIKYKAANGNSIILPAAGYISDKKLKSAGIKGFYMCGSEYAAKSPYFSDSLGREAGISVRPVIDIDYDIEIDAIIQRTEYCYPLHTENGMSIVFRAYALVNNEDISSYIDEHGVIIYKNNEPYAEFEGYKGFTELRIEADINDLEFTTAPSGAKIYSTKSNWSASSYYVKKDHYGNSVKYYGNKKQPIDFIYHSNSIRIKDIWLDSTKQTRYHSYDLRKMLTFHLLASVELDTIDQTVADYGIVIYKNNKEYNTSSAHGRNTVNYELDIDYSSMNISRNDSGEYIATPKDVWTVGSFITRRNSDTHDGFNEYGDEIIPLDITYKKRPCISIEDFSCNNPEETSTEDVVKSDIKIYLKIDGGFFMNNAEISITNEYISKTDNEQTNNQIFLLKQVFPTYSLYHDNKRYWFTDGTLKQEYNKIISYTDSTKGDAVSREATISFSCNLEHDGTRLSTGKLNYKLLHNGKVSLNLIE